MLARRRPRLEADGAAVAFALLAVDGGRGHGEGLEVETVRHSGTQKRQTEAQTSIQKEHYAEFISVCERQTGAYSVQ